MYIDHRTYNFFPGKMQAWIDAYERLAWPLQQKYLGRCLGFFRSDIGPLNQVVHLWAYDSLDDRQARRDAMMKDPAWPDFTREVERLGCLQSQEIKILVPVKFPPVK